MTTATATATRPPAPAPPQPGPHPGPHPGGRARRAALVVAGVVLLLLAGGWSLGALAGPAPAGPGAVAMPDGLARVDLVASAARPAHAMPGMGADDDPVAEGHRRVSVDVTLQATGDAPLRFEVDRFALTVPGSDPVRPHRSVLPGDELPAGTSLSGTLVFDVPAGATTGGLSYGDGPATALDLPPETGSRPPAATDAPAPGAPEDLHGQVHP